MCDDAEHRCRYLDIRLRLVTFDSTRNHPAHIQQLVHSHLTVLHLTHIIRRETSVAARRILVFVDRDQPDPLPDDRSLEQCGFVGGTTHTYFHKCKKSFK